MALQIHQQWAKIGLIIDKPRIEMETRQPQLNMETSRPEIRIESPDPKIIIDQEDCFKSYFKMDITDFAAYFARKGQQACLEGIQRRVAEGDVLAAIEKGGSIASIAAHKLDRTREFAIRCLPEHPPRIEAITEPITVEFLPGYVNTAVQPGSVETYFQWGKVKAYLEQKNVIAIQWVDPEIDNVV